MVAPHMPMPATEVMNPLGEFAPATIHVVDYDAPDGSRPAGMVRLTTSDTDELTAELTEAVRNLVVHGSKLSNQLLVFLGSNGSFDQSSLAVLDILSSHTAGIGGSGQLYDTIAR